MKSFSNWLEQRGISLWLDDERDPRDEIIQKKFGAKGDELWVKTADDAIEILKAGKVTHVSLDHDLGLPEAGTGYDVAKWIEKHAYLGESPRLGWRIHTQNPIGRSNMEQALQNADKYWSI